MDDRLEEEHDFRKTMEAAAELGDDPHEKHRANKLDHDIVYELLAVNSSMGMFGMEEITANLMQLELAQEMMYKEQLESDGTLDMETDEND